MKRLILVCCAAAGLMACGGSAPVPQAGVSTAPAPAVKPPAQREAVAVYVVGTVEQLLSGQQEWKSVEIGDAIAESSSVRTGADAALELQVGSKAVFRLEPNTTVQLQRMFSSPEKTDVRIGVVGAVVSRVNKLNSNDRYQVETPSAVCAVRGTVFLVRSDPTGQGSVAVSEGRVVVVPPAAAPLEQPGQAALDIINQVEAVALSVQVGQEAVVDPAAFKASEASLGKIIAAAESGTAPETTAVAAVINELAAAKPEAAPLSEAALTSFESVKAMEVAPLDNAAAAPVPIVVRTEPADATISLAGSVLAIGRYAGLRAVGEKLKFTIAKPGFADRVLSLEVGKDGLAYTVRLDPKPEASVPAPEPSAPAAAPSESPSPAPDASAQPVASAVPAAAPSASPLASASPAAPAVRKVAVSLSALPADAEVLIDGKAVGKGTWQTELDEGAAVDLTVRRLGYADKALHVEAKAAMGAMTVELDPAPILATVKTGAGSLVGQLVSGGDSLFVADKAGKVVSVAQAGRLAWLGTTANSPNDLGIPVRAGGLIVHYGKAGLVALDAASGKLAFERKDLGQIFGQRPAWNGKLLFVPTPSGIQVIDPAAGSETVSTYALPTSTQASPALWQDKLVVPTMDGGVQVLEAATGKLVATIATSAAQPTALAPAIQGNRAYFAGRKGTAVCVDLASGAVVWTADVGKGASLGVSSDLVADKSVVCLWAKETLYVLDAATGKEKFPPLTGVSTMPLLAQGKVWVGTKAGALDGIDPANGSVAAHLALPAVPATAPAVLGERMALGLRDGTVVFVVPAAIK